VCFLRYEAAFTGDADRCEWVITCDHPTCHVGLTKRKDRRGGARFEFVFEYDETQEAKI
jgi:hypothetical protein